MAEKLPPELTSSSSPSSTSSPSLLTPMKNIKTAKAI
eukprot:CAMPEP_0194113450 /NCGR_PEP_ID=MMETSP0150-20130528/16726_1 /TAXON_ID=122233 /ORGANISM="Chaetoceros debilis, Strain MM31A-1" /LENGTH=36 /DNA_ID= /DNA_START= /DNA_END= /DNA_ORIENTATION=